MRKSILIRRIIKSIFGKFGYTVINTNLFESLNKRSVPYDMETDFKEIYVKAKNFTMASLSQNYTMYKATEYVINNNIPGDIIECGVWKGGNMMISAYTLLKLRSVEKILYLFDTYEGMSKPSRKDIRSYDNKPASEISKIHEKNDFEKWDYASLEEVKRNLYSTKYPQEKILFIKGKVEDTIPKTIPEKISILRLDTDFYESTYHELVHLYPKLSINGVLIIDDYGYWKGQKEAVDQYFKEHNIYHFLIRLGDQGRMAIKTG